MQSPSQSDRTGLHVAIIMDGSGRWARERGLERPEGHLAGVETVRRMIAAAADAGVSTLTLHSFSSGNWQRPPEEVARLFGIFEDFLFTEPTLWILSGVRLSVIGRRDRLPASLLQTIEYAESATSGCTRFHLRLAIDYSARHAILEAAQRWNAAGPQGSSPEDQKAEFEQLLAGTEGEAVPEVDLLIRTGGEQRLSDFMLWECAYAELYFTSVLWPDFTGEDLRDALKEFHSRDRRFGAVPAAVEQL
ncbi:MAG TPA: polyprenyl diphosphate synthase [Terriglobia bacterium]|nr:polyprenyl diphosphate synthase [Terriglobia bacterium]